jgi:hypothetical protein
MNLLDPEALARRPPAEPRPDPGPLPAPSRSRDELMLRPPAAAPRRVADGGL